MAEVVYSNDAFKQLLMSISTGLIWKNTNKAIENESSNINDLYLSELFVLANRGLLSFSVVKNFPKAVLENLFPGGLPNGVDLESAASNKKLIPEKYRDMVTEEYQRALTSKHPQTGLYMYERKDVAGNKWYTEVYVEKNNYYRMLNGLPDLDEPYESFVYIKNDDRFDPDTPVHAMNTIDRFIIEDEGILDKLIAANPTKEYLKFIGRKKIDLFKARVADKFDILAYNGSSSELFDDDFIAYYNRAKNMIVNVYYSQAIKKQNEIYDGFIAMAILFATIQAMQYKYLQVDITRDFYDTESLKLIYDSYGVPFYSEIPLEYHRRIVKNINKLISYKGSSKVFVDLFALFDMGTVDIFNYFLVKERIMDKDGYPIMEYMKDEDGNIIYDDKGKPILDPSNYKIRFSRVKLNSDPALAVSDSINDVEYKSLTEPDPYWIEDHELIDKMDKEYFNFMESKYMGIQTVYDLMKITFENAYSYRMISDNRELTEALTFRWGDVNVECSLYDIFIYTACLFCARYGYEGIIDTNVPALMDSLGYNFDAAREFVAQHINDSPGSEFYDLMKIMDSFNLSTIERADKTYGKIFEIRNFLIDKFSNAKTIEEFNVYRDLYYTLLNSKLITDTYKDSHGDIYKNFFSILMDCNTDLAQRFLLLMDNTDYDNELLLVTNQLERLISNLKYLPLSLGLNSTPLVESLFKILKFFKSAKTELIGYNIVYVLTSRGDAFIKYMDKIHSWTTLYKDDQEHVLVDIIKYYRSLYEKYNEYQLMYTETDDLRFRVRLMDSIQTLKDLIIRVEEVIKDIIKSDTHYIDILVGIRDINRIQSLGVINDCKELFESYYDVLEPKYFGLIKDEINKLTDILKMIGSPKYQVYEELVMIDKIRLIIEFIKSKFKTTMEMEDMIHKTISYTDSKDNIEFIDKLVEIEEIFKLSDIMEIVDNLIKSIDFSKYQSIDNFIDILISIYSSSTRDISVMKEVLFETSRILRLDSSSFRVSDKFKLDNEFVSDLLRNIATHIDTIIDNNNFLGKVSDPLIPNKKAMGDSLIETSRAGIIDPSSFTSKDSYTLDDIRYPDIMKNISISIDDFRPYTQSGEMEELSIHKDSLYEVINNERILI